MPNHVLNEIVFRDIDPIQKDAILSHVRSSECDIDFCVLLPIPLNVWQGNVGIQHETAFRKANTALAWCAENWGTKWGAYGLNEGGRYRSIVAENSTLTLIFQTAWRPPYGWLLALWHKTGLPFEYTWLDQGRDTAIAGRFTSYDGDMLSEPWLEATAEEATTRRMHKLLWGVESFENEDEPDHA